MGAHALLFLCEKRPRASNLSLDSSKRLLVKKISSKGEEKAAGCGSEKREVK
jgi:hypothetical protein